MKTIKKILLTICIFQFVLVSAQYSKLLDFAGVTNGSYPNGSLISDGTFLYGMTPQGGVNNYGTIFKIKPDGTGGYGKLFDFAQSSIGGNPVGTPIFDGTFLYGMTSCCGAYGWGTIFKIKTDGTEYSKLFDFDGILGGTPYGSLISDGTFLYGMTFQGGINSVGAIFKIKPDGTNFTKLLDFNGMLNGKEPSGDLFLDGSFLYGMTSSGGVNYFGTIFKIKTDGTEFTKILDFSGLNGRYPFGNLISDGTFLYGMTRGGGIGGIYAVGTIFKIKPDGTEYTKLLDFNYSNGSKPYGSLTFDGTFLYGMTREGSPNNLGNIFKIKPDGTGFTTLLEFNGTLNGKYPYGNLLLINGNSLYGMTESGGVNYDQGTIFKFLLSALSVADNNNNLDVLVYPNPVKNILNIQNPENLSFDKITITDLTGKKVLEQKTISNAVNVEKLQSGMYLLQITSEGKNSVTKFIKQ